MGALLSREDKSQPKEFETLYGFIRNDAINATDKLGLDRYITQFDILNLGGSGGTQIHVGVAVDKWKKSGGKWVKSGTVTFDFSADPLYDSNKVYEGLGDIDFLNIFAALGYGRGVVKERGGLKLHSPQTLESSPCQDIRMLEMLRKDVANPPFYSVLTHNCVFWSVGAVQYGMDKAAEGKCCNPDKTTWKR